MKIYILSTNRMEVSYIRELCREFTSDEITETKLEELVRTDEQALYILGEGYSVDDGHIVRSYARNAELCFVSQNVSEAFAAWRLHACGFFTDDYTKEEFHRAIAIARAMLRSDSGHMVTIQTMPTFDVFIDGKVLQWKGRQTKEAFALAVDRFGGTISTADMVTCIWPDRPWDSASQNLANKVRHKMVRELKEAGIDSIISVNRTTYAIDRNAVFCDYFNIMENRVDASVAYKGSYMREYDWAEETNAQLEFAASKNRI